MSPVRVFDALYRLRWWTFAPFLVVLVLFGGVSDRRDNPAAWLTLGLLILVVWLPVAVRWVRSAGDAHRAFRDSVNGS